MKTKTQKFLFRVQHASIRSEVSPSGKVTLKKLPKVKPRSKKKVWRPQATAAASALLKRMKQNEAAFSPLKIGRQETRAPHRH